MADQDERAQAAHLMAVGAARICEASAALLDDLSRLRPLWDGPQPRAASGLGIKAVLDFLRRIDPEDVGDRSRPLGELLGALHELEQGRSPELLRPKRLNHRPPEGVRLRTVQAQAVAIAEILVKKTGMTEEAADIEVGKALHKAGLQMGKLTTPTGKVVAGWRNKLSLAKCDPGHRWVYERMVAYFEAMPPATDDGSRHALRRELLALLAEEVRIRGGLRQPREEYPEPPMF